MNDDIIPIEEVLGKDYLSLKDELRNAADNQQRMNILNRYFESRIRFNNLKLNNLSNISENFIIHKKGNININTLISEWNVSRRTLERKFMNEIGMPPKLFCKVIRFNHAFLLKRMNPETSWQEIVYQCGYYDQSHYIAEFKYFTGFSPSVYYDKDVTISALYTGSFLEEK